MSVTDSPRYALYIASPEWAAMRKAKLAQVGARCQECSDTERLEREAGLSRQGVYELLDRRPS